MKKTLGTLALFFVLLFISCVHAEGADEERPNNGIAYIEENYVKPKMDERRIKQTNYTKC